MERELTVRHIHHQTFSPIECYHGAVVFLSQVNAYRGDIILRYLSLADKTLHCSLNPNGFTVYHSLNLVDYNIIQTLLQGLFVCHCHCFHT